MALEENLHEKLIRLAQTLLSGTKGGKVAWSSTDSEYEYLCTGTRSSVTIESLVDREGDRISTLNILNDHGTVVDSLRSGFIQEDSGDGYSSQPWNSVLDELFYSARRVAYNVDDAIDGMLADIQKGISAPGPPQRRQASPDPWSETAQYSDEPPF